MKIIKEAKNWQVLKCKYDQIAKDCHCSDQRCFAD